MADREAVPFHSDRRVGFPWNPVGICVIGGYTGDQRFFMAWAQVWKRVARDEQIKNQVATDPHSPARYRVNGVVRNMDAWYEAFGVSTEDALYLDPEDRVQIW